MEDVKIKYGPYSPSRLDTALCGYAFKRQYIDPGSKGKRTEGLPQARGSAVHEVFEEITRQLCRGKQSFAPDFVRRLVVEAVTRHPPAYEESAAIMEMARMYINKPPAGLEPDAEVELRMAVKFGPDDFVECDYDDPEALARGRADIFMISADTTTAFVYDHKTQPNVEEADTFQLGFYAWVISKVHPYLNEIRTILHFARYAKYSQPFIWRKNGEVYDGENPDEIGDLREIEDQVLTKIAIIENRTQWEATPNKNCQYCPYIAECPVLSEIFEPLPDGNYRVNSKGVQILGDTQRAVKVAGLLNVMEEVVNAAKKNLKEHVEAYGPIAIPGKIWSFKASEEKVDWDRVNGKKMREQAYEIFAKHKVDPKAWMGFSQTFSRDIWRSENVALLKELAELFPKTIDTSFRGSKA
jgi:hypothetical protein